MVGSLIRGLFGPAARSLTVSYGILAELGLASSIAGIVRGRRNDPQPQ